MKLCALLNFSVWVGEITSQISSRIPDSGHLSGGISETTSGRLTGLRYSVDWICGLISKISGRIPDILTLLRSEVFTNIQPDTGNRPYISGRPDNRNLNQFIFLDFYVGTSYRSVVRGQNYWVGVAFAIGAVLSGMNCRISGGTYTH